MKRTKKLKQHDAAIKAWVKIRQKRNGSRWRIYFARRDNGVSSAWIYVKRHTWVRFAVVTELTDIAAFHAMAVALGAEVREV